MSALRYNDTLNKYKTQEEIPDDLPAGTVAAALRLAVWWVNSTRGAKIEDAPRFTGEQYEALRRLA